MKNKSQLTKYFLIILSTSLISLAGCNEDFFDQAAGDRITPDKHYKTMTDADVSMQGALVLLQDAMPRLVVLQGLLSDEMDVTPNASQQLVEINNHVFNKGNSYLDPADLYKVIINVNEVLANIDSVARRDRDFNSLVSHQYKGALIGLRSWTYFTLVRLFGKAAYFEDNLTSLPDNFNKYIMGRAEIIDKLIEDITPYIHDNSAGGQQFEELRIRHYMNTKALLGQLYLEKGNYTEAARYLKLACESYNNQSAVLKVERSYRDDAWLTIFLNAESQPNENISVVPFSRAENQYNPIAYWLGHDRLYMIKPTAMLVDSFMMQYRSAGPQGDLYRGKGISFNVDTIAWINDSTFITEPYITKYAIDANDPFSSDIIISRAADLHLLLAEAYNRLGDETSQKFALMLLNQGVNAENPKPPAFARWSGNLGVRGRVSLASRMVPERDSIPLEERITLIEDLILAERSMELAFEGKRWSDLVRIAERRNDPQYLADKVAEKFRGTSKYEEIHAKLMNPANWYLPF